jgi:hypothetical protein
MAKKVTMKEQVLQFVEQRGSVRYTDIIKFIVDTKFGANTYDNAKGKDTYYRANPYRGYFSAAFSGGSTWKNGKREYQPGYFLKGADCLEKVGKLYYTVRTAIPKVPKTVQPKVKREYPRFTNETLKVIEKLQSILQCRDSYLTQSAFLKEIEGLKFPHLTYSNKWQSRRGNLYTGQQYNSILNLCIKLGWIKIERKDNRGYKVIVLVKVHQSLPAELQSVKATSLSDVEMKKAMQIAENSTYGSYASEDTSGPFQGSKTKMSLVERMADIKTLLHDNLSVNIALDPSLNWIVKTIDGKSYLSIKN